LVIFFNVKEVREFLIKNGLVYTLRKKRFRVGNDTAVYGSRFKQKKIGKVFIELIPIGKITNSETLVVFFDYSGLNSSASSWFELGKQLSGDNLYLYRVTMKLEERIKGIIAHASKSLLEDLEDFGIVGNGFWESVEEDILEAIKNYKVTKSK